MNKKGELSTKQIVTLIILIVSFSVILLLLFRLDLGKTTEKEICHNSVVLKAQGKLGLGTLDCKTTYLCLSSGEECSDFLATSHFEVETEEEIKKAIQKEMDDCWWMFGEGKLDYVGNWINKPGIFETHICAICSVIKFDEKIQNGFPQIDFEGKIIDTSEEYSIGTGMEDKNEYIEPFIVESQKISTETTCERFITKA